MEAAKAFDRVCCLQESEVCKGRRRGILHAACFIRHIREDSHRCLMISVYWSHPYFRVTLLYFMCELMKVPIDTLQQNWSLVTLCHSLQYLSLKWKVGRDSSVGIATRYGLDGPGIESRWERDLPHSSKAALGPTQPHIQWVPCLSWG
jgi:hypothetical protein